MKQSAHRDDEDDLPIRCFAASETKARRASTSAADGTCGNKVRIVAKSVTYCLENTFIKV